MTTKGYEGNGTMRDEFRRSGDGSRAVLRETARAVTPFAGLSVLVESWRELDLIGAVRVGFPFDYRSSSAIGAAEILYSFWLSVTAGARRFAHVNLVRGDVALRQLLN